MQVRRSGWRQAARDDRDAGRGRRVACRRDERIAFGGLERSGWVVNLDELA